MYGSILFQGDLGAFPNLLPEAEFNKQKEEAGEVGQICLLSGVRKLGKPPKKLRSKKLGLLWPFIEEKNMEHGSSFFGQEYGGPALEDLDDDFKEPA